MVEDLTEESLLRAFDEWRADMRKPIVMDRRIKPPKPDAPKIDTGAFELLAKLVAEALRRAKKDGSYKR